MPLACLFIFLYVFLIFRKKHRLHTATSLVFAGIVLFTGLHILSAVVTEYTVNNRDTVSELFNYGWHLAFLISLSLTASMLYMYVILYVERGTGIRKIKSKISLAVVTALSILGEILLPITYIDTEFGSYSYGPKAFSLYLVVVYSMVMMTCSVIKYQKVLTRDRSFIILSTVSIFVGISIIQILFPYILLTSLGATMIMLGLICSTEDAHTYTTSIPGVFNELGCREILREAVLNLKPFQIGIYIFVGLDEMVAQAMCSIKEQLPERKSHSICCALADNMLVVIPLQWKGKSYPLPPLPQPKFREEDVSYGIQTMEFSSKDTIDGILDSLREFKRRYEDDALMRDELTGYLRRAPFVREMAYMIKSGRSFTFLMTDMDNFKEVNDTHGHNTGDEVIRLIAKRIQNELRPTDVLCRMGGDEFGIILPGVTSRDNILQITNRLQESIRQVQQEFGKNTKVSLSIGAKTSSHDSTNRSFQAVYEEADQALYYSKNNGKCRTTFADDISQLTSK